MHAFGMKLLEAGTALIAAELKLPLHQCRDMMTRCTDMAIAVLGVERSRIGELPFEDRLTIIRTTMGFLHIELERIVTREQASHMVAELEAFYIRLRGDQRATG